MTQTAPNPPPPAPPPPHQQQPASVLPLDYGRAAKPSAIAFADWAETNVVVALLRRLVLALGSGLLVYGLVFAFVKAFNDSYYTDDASVTAGWGAALIVLVWPWPRLLRRPELAGDPTRAADAAAGYATQPPPPTSEVR